VYVGDALLARRCCLRGWGACQRQPDPSLAWLTRVGFGRQTSDADSGTLSATWILGAFLVTAALAEREGVDDLAQRSVRWRVSLRWSLVALFTVPVGATLISLDIYGPSARTYLTVAGREHSRSGRRLCASAVQLAKEIGFTRAADPRFVECERAAQVFLGSRARKQIRHSPVPVLILPRHADD
jgi:hypothetical protein